MQKPKPSKPKISIAIVDDSETYREALVYYFSQIDDIEVLFEASDGLKLVEELKIRQPQVILLDINMPNLDGAAALKQLRDKYPSIKFIILTVNLEQTVIKSFLESGANSFLNKSAAAAEIHKAIIKCSESDFYMNDWINDALVFRTSK